MSSAATPRIPTGGLSIMVGVIAIASLGAQGSCLAQDAGRIVRLDRDAETIHLTNVPGDEPYSVVVEGISAAQRQAPNRPSRSERTSVRQPTAVIRELVRAAGLGHRLEPALIYAVMAAESGYAPHAVSSKGASGLMQLMPATATRYGVTDLFDPAQNIEAGARHLRGLLDRFNGSMPLALAAYNAGAAAVLRHGGSVPPYAETLAYVPQVLMRYQALREAAAARPGGDAR